MTRIQHLKHGSDNKLNHYMPVFLKKQRGLTIWSRDLNRLHLLECLENLLFWEFMGQISINLSQNPSSQRLKKLHLAIMSIKWKYGLKIINRYIVQLITFLQSPWSFWSLEILFLHWWLEALWWKYLIILSPLANYATLDLWCHISYSFSN